MTIGKSKLLEAARRVRAEIYRTVEAELLEGTRTHREVAEANCISVATVERIAGKLRDFKASKAAPEVGLNGGQSWNLMEEKYPGTFSRICCSSGGFAARSPQSRKS